MILLCVERRKKTGKLVFNNLLFWTQMVLVLKKEVVKTNNVEHEDTGKYRQLLVRTLHQCCIKFQDIAATIIPVVCVTTLKENLKCPDKKYISYNMVKKISIGYIFYRANSIDMCTFRLFKKKVFLVWIGRL